MIFILFLLFFPFLAFGHEVYVLSPEEIRQALLMDPVSPFLTIAGNFSQFLFWALVTAIVIPTLFAMSLSRRLEKILHPFLSQVREYAPLLVRLGVGGSLVTSAFFGAFIGPELPLEVVFGSFAPIAMFLWGITGVLILFEKYARLAGVLGLCLYTYAIFAVGPYLITYIEFAAAFAYFVIGPPSRDAAIPQSLVGYVRVLQPYRFAILRVGFGLSVMFASVYAKILYSPLALTVVEKFDLTSYWIFSAFEPNFLVLGAAIIEFLCGLLIVLGLEIRHTAAFLAFWLTLSLAYFQEMVWPHIILFGLGGAFLLYGYDWYSLEGRFFKHGNRENPL